MFEQHRLVGDTRIRLRLDTKERNPIKNEVAPRPNSQALRKDASLWQKNADLWQRRAEPRGVYNCAGLVWAARRTAIYADAEWNQILEEDGYRELGGVDDVSIGDIAVYAAMGAGGYLHVGVVIATDEISPMGRPMPRILSKWDDTSGEYLHLVPNVPFEDWKVTYWTDR